MNYTCDWPGLAGGACGAPAVRYIDHGSVHRPVCAEHARTASQVSLDTSCPFIELVDPAKVPKKTPTQVERVKSQELPPASPSIPHPAMPSRPPLRQAVAELGAALLDLAKGKLEDWRSK
jgi:hypothetical protein